MIEHQRSGILVPPDDPAAMGDAIRLLVEDESLRRRLGQAARVRAEEEFDIGVTQSKIEQVYAGLLPSPSVQSPRVSQR